MKVIKIFLASSEELEKERDLIPALANGLNTSLSRIGVMVNIVRWEDLDSSMGVEHKQEEYNKRQW